MKILVTGNLGYVGPVVVRHLRNVLPGVEVTGFDAGYFEDCLLAPGAGTGYEPHRQLRGDVRHFAIRALAGVDAVVHLAGVSNDPIGNAFEATTLAVNHAASVELAYAARRAGVRNFVFASSCSVYGCAEEGARNETSQVNPLTAYARSKVLAEKSLASLATDEFTVTCLRFATACGVSPRLRLDLVLNDFVYNAVARGEIRILSDGTPWRPLIAVSDMARAVEWAATRESANGGAFAAVNAGCDEWNYQVRDLAAAVASEIPGTAIHTNPDAQPDKRSYRVSFELFRRLAPRHQPQATLAGTIAELRQALTAAGAAERDFPVERFVRLQTLHSLAGSGDLDEELLWRELVAR